MHDFVALDPLHLRGVAKLTEADGAGNLSRLAKQPLAAWPLQVGGDPTLAVRVQEVFPAPLPRGERGCGQRPRCWQDPWGSRSRGQCAVGTHFKGFGGLRGARALLTRHNGISQRLRCVALLGCLVIGGRMSPVSLKLPHAPCAPYHLITFKCSCRASLWPLAEPFQPKLGLSL